MFGLSTLGVVHTLISLAALAAGVACLFRAGRITPRRRSGALYVLLTVLSCLTSFGIVAHGGFGKAHALAVLTLATLVVASVAGAGARFRRRARAVEAVAYSASLLFHMIPGVTETLTRLPHAHPVVDGPDAPALQAVNFLMLVAFVLGAWYQVRRLGESDAGAALEVRIAGLPRG